MKYKLEDIKIERERMEDILHGNMEVKKKGSSRLSPASYELERGTMSLIFSSNENLACG